MGEINNINATKVLLARDYASTKMIKIPIIGIIDDGGILSYDNNGVIMSFHQRLQYNEDETPKFIKFYRISTGSEDNNYIPGQKEYKHGTHVASIIGANDDTKDISYEKIGVNPCAHLISLDISIQDPDGRFYRTANDDKILKNFFSWIAGVPICEKKYKLNNVEYQYPNLLTESNSIIGADVLNCSWGIFDTGVHVDGAIDVVTSFGRNGLGTIVCFASGNEDTSLTETSNSLFAQHKKTITVAAVCRHLRTSNVVWKRWKTVLFFDKNKYKEADGEGSNYNGIDVCAPCGLDLKNEKSTFCRVLSYDDSANLKKDDFFSGTSAATPLVSGVISLMLSITPNLNWLEVRKILRDTASKENLYDSEDGLSHFNKKGFCPAYGYGMVNAENAVKKADGYGHYDLSIENVDQSNSKKITITVKNVSESNVSSIEGAELRCLLRYVSSDNPQFTFPDFWMENNIDTYLLDTKDIEALAKGDSVDYSIKKPEIEKYLKAIDKKKGIKPYLMFHVTPFDNDDTRDNPNENNNLYVCLLEYNDTKFLDSTGEHRLQKRFEKTDTQLSCIIKIEPSVEGWDVTQKNMKLTIRMEYMETSMEYLFRFDTDDWCYENNNDGGISLQWDAESGNTHCTIPIGQDCEKIILSTEIDGYLKICTHEIRRKSAIFSKFTSALVEDMEFREKIYFFTDCDNLSNTKKYGAISSGDTDFQTGFDRYRITNVFAVEGTQETNTGTGTETTNETNSESSTPHKAYAVCKGKILVQEDKDDASLVNIVLKPEMHSSNNPAVKYFVYRGILKSSLYESDNSLKTNGNSVVSWIEKNIKEPDGRILGMELTNDASFGDEASIDNAFYNSDGEFELLTVPAGWCIGTFADNYIGFEIWLDTIGFNPTFSMIRNHETIIAVEQLPMNPTDGDISAHKAQKEQILNYMDPAAYFGNLYDDRIFVRNTNSEASRDGIEYSFEKVKKENLYTQIIDNFLNKNVVYIDIRNEFNTSYNYFGNYGNVLLKVLNNKNQPTPDDCYNCYGNSDWPIIATIFTPSFDGGVVKIAFKKGDNETPLAYAAIGERGRTIAEKIAQGKTNFVDLTAENGDYTDNSVAMIVPFRTNTAPNMENTYISVASYMRIDYLRRMKPTTPNNQEPQEQQEPLAPEIIENLPVWKQRESSADLLFRPMDMKLPIENVTEGFVVKVYEDEVYINVPEHQIDYMARMGIARDPDNTYLFAVKSDLHTKNAFQMSNPRVSICSGFYKTGVSFLNYLTQNNLYKITINETDEFVLKIEKKYAKDYLIAPDKETDFVIFAFSNQEYEKILQSIQSINNAQSSVYLSMKEIEKYEKASSYNLQLTYINADNQVKNSTIQIENNDNKLTMLG
jgi:subtilisin family serine protease